MIITTLSFGFALNLHRLAC